MRQDPARHSASNNLGLDPILLIPLVLASGNVCPLMISVSFLLGVHAPVMGAAILRTGRGEQWPCRSRRFPLRSGHCVISVRSYWVLAGSWHIVTRHRDPSATPARRYESDRASGSSSPVGEPVSSSDSQASTASTTASLSVTVRPCSNPWETSVVRRICARSGEDEPGSTQARMMNSPMRDVVTG